MTIFRLLSWFNIVFSLAILLAVSATPTNSDSNVEILAIPNTTLFTGVFYTIDMKANEGRLDYSFTTINSNSKGPNYMQVTSLKYSHDYHRGAIYWTHTQWMFVPSEVPGFYIIINQFLPHAYLILSKDDADNTNQKFVGLLQNADTNVDYLRGAKYRRDALWTIRTQVGAMDMGKEIQHYNIFNSRFNASGIMGMSNGSIADGKIYVKIFMNQNEETAGKDEYLWKLTPSTSAEVPVPRVTDILAIPKTNLHTGVFYTIDMKANGGRLDYSFTTMNSNSVKPNYMQATSLKYSHDYHRGAIYWNHTQWMFVPSEVPELYVIINQFLPHAYLILAKDDANNRNQKFVGLLQGADKNSDYLEGGKYRRDALWIIKQQLGATAIGEESQQLYNIFNSHFNGSGIMGMSNGSIADGKNYVKVFAYQNEGIARKDEYLWKITPSSPIEFADVKHTKIPDMNIENSTNIIPDKEDLVKSKRNGAGETLLVCVVYILICYR